MEDGASIMRLWWHTADEGTDRTPAMKLYHSNEVRSGILICKRRSNSTTTFKIENIKSVIDEWRKEIKDILGVIINAFHLID